MSRTATARPLSAAPAPAPGSFAWELDLAVAYFREHPRCAVLDIGKCVDVTRAESARLAYIAQHGSGPLAF